MNKFGEFLYQLRKEKGITQSELADKLDITNKAVSKWETGESFPETAQLVPISKIFGVTVDELLNGERNADNPYIEEEDKPIVPLRPFSMKESVLIALGVFLIIIGVILLIVITSVLDMRFDTAIAVSTLLFFVALSVVIFMLTGLKRRIESVELQGDVKKKGMNYAIYLSIGVALIILSPILLLFLIEITVDIVGIAALLGLIAVALMILIPSGIGWGNFIKQHNIPEDEDEQKLSGSAKRVSDALCSVIMLCAVATFLILGFVYSKWHPGWVVFPIGGLLCGMVSTVAGAKGHRHIDKK